MKLKECKRCKYFSRQNSLEFKNETELRILDQLWIVGWIDCDSVTVLIGINEARKSNLLLALWKLNPARERGIGVLHDMPVSKHSTYRKKTESVKFITAEFELDDKTVTQIESTVGCSLEVDKSLTTIRYYDKHCSFEFPSGKPILNRYLKSYDIDIQMKLK